MTALEQPHHKSGRLGFNSAQAMDGDEAFLGCQFSVDRIFLARQSLHLVLVYRQVIVQRVLSARDEGHAKSGSNLRRLPEDPAGVHACTGQASLLLRCFPEQVKKPDFAYPTLVLNLLPVGLVGLVMAALLAAVMGAMSSVFIQLPRSSLSILQEAPAASFEKQLVNFGRVPRDDGGAGLAVGPVYPLHRSQLYIYLQACRLYQSADLRLF